MAESVPQIQQDLEDTARKLNNDKYVFDNPALNVLFDVIGDFLDDVGMESFKDYMKVFVPQKPVDTITILKPVFANTFTGMTWQETVYTVQMPQSHAVLIPGADMTTWKKVLTVISVVAWIGFYAITIAVIWGAVYLLTMLVEFLGDRFLPSSLSQNMAGGNIFSF